MSDEMLRLLVGGVLLLHGVGHGGALGALLWMRYRPDASTGDWLAARSWVAPSLPPEAAAQVAGAFWIVSLAGFAVAALSFWGIVLPDDLWRPVATGSAVVSMAGILAFLGTWPIFNTIAALGVNVAVLTAVVWLRWPPQALFIG
jgi:hypothetical protein